MHLLIYLYIYTLILPNMFRKEKILEPERLSQNLSVCIKVGTPCTLYGYVHETENRIVSVPSALTKSFVFIYSVHSFI